ncbi:cation transport protein-domain-containing protein [Tuber brumale]|nr:cation transport protein-domain-containing protein [Tuber brumale]
MSEVGVWRAESVFIAHLFYSICPLPLSWQLTNVLSYLEKVVLRAADGSALPMQTTQTSSINDAGTTPNSSEAPAGSRIVWDVPASHSTRGAHQSVEEKAHYYDTSRSTAGAIHRSSVDTIREITDSGDITRADTGPASSSSRHARAVSRENSPSRNRLSFRKSRDDPPAPYLSYTPSVGRNSRFYDLTEEQRNELGGIEYRSLKTLAWILIAYYVFIHIFGVIMFVPYLLRSLKYEKIFDDFGVNKSWWGAYTAMSSFANVGFMLTPDSMVSFQRASFMLIISGFLIIAGNTGFPLLLRFTIWCLFKMCPERYPDKRDELNFLLDHPRRCFTLLFPSGPTWWLFWILTILNVADTVLFIVLDLQTPVVESIPAGYRVLNALFQAVSTRTAGISSVPIGSLHPGIQCSYLIMMYISVLPLAISIRRTNVYEEHSLGIYIPSAEAREAQEGERNEGTYIKAHIRRQLEFDLWYVFLGLFLICVAEGRRIADASDYAFTAFSVFFEVVSAYGDVGLSLGYPGLNTSLSGTFTTFSKLVIVAMEIRGRHRGLPYDVDRAVLLPNMMTPDSMFAPDGARLEGVKSRDGEKDEEI